MLLSEIKFTHRKCRTDKGEWGLACGFPWLLRVHIFARSTPKNLSNYLTLSATSQSVKTAPALAVDSPITRGGGWIIPSTISGFHEKKKDRKRTFWMFNVMNGLMCRTYELQFFNCLIARRKNKCHAIRNDVRIKFDLSMFDFESSSVGRWGKMKNASNSAILNSLKCSACVWV